LGGAKPPILGQGRGGEAQRAENGAGLLGKGAVSSQGFLSF